MRRATSAACRSRATGVAHLHGDVRLLAHDRHRHVLGHRERRAESGWGASGPGIPRAGPRRRWAGASRASTGARATPPKAPPAAMDFAFYVLGWPEVIHCITSTTRPPRASRSDWARRNLRRVTHAVPVPGHAQLMRGVRPAPSGAPTGWGRPQGPDEVPGRQPAKPDLALCRICRIADPAPLCRPRASLHSPPIASSFPLPDRYRS